MPTRRIKLLEPTPMQAQMMRESRRFNVCCTGRRAGKSELAVHLACMEVLKGGHVAYTAPTYSQTLDPWRAILNILAPVIREKSNDQHRIALENSGTLELFSLDGSSPDVIRGKKFSLLLIDEAGMIDNLEDVFWSVLRPCLTDLAGFAWMLSTPRGMNSFYRFWLLGQDPLNAEWRSWKMPSSANPYLDPEEILSAKRMMPEWRFNAEYEGEFVDSGQGIFRYIDEAIDSRLPVSGPVRGHSYVVSADIGRVSDFTAISVIDETDRSLCFLDRFTGLDFGIQVQRLKAICDRFRPMQVLIESNNFGLPFIDQCRKEGMAITAWTTTNASKSAAIESLAASFEQRSISIPNDAVLLSELRSFMVTTTATGLSKYGAPPGQHDDSVLSLMIGWAAISGLVAKPVVPRAMWLGGEQESGFRDSWTSFGKFNVRGWNQ